MSSESRMTLQRASSMASNSESLCENEGVGNEGVGTSSNGALSLLKGGHRGRCKPEGSRAVAGPRVGTCASWSGRSMWSVDKVEKLYANGRAKSKTHECDSIFHFYCRALILGDWCLPKWSGVSGCRIKETKNHL